MIGKQWAKIQGLPISHNTTKSKSTHRKTVDTQNHNRESTITLSHTTGVDTATPVKNQPFHIEKYNLHVSHNAIFVSTVGFDSSNLIDWAYKELMPNTNANVSSQQEMTICWGTHMVLLKKRQW